MNWTSSIYLATLQSSGIVTCLNFSHSSSNVNSGWPNLSKQVFFGGFYFFGLSGLSGLAGLIFAFFSNFELSSFSFIDVFRVNSVIKFSLKYVVNFSCISSIFSYTSIDSWLSLRILKGSFSVNCCSKSSFFWDEIGESSSKCTDFLFFLTVYISDFSFIFFSVL